MIKKDIKTLQKNLNKLEKDLLDPADITNKLFQLEDKSRRNNLRIGGIEEINNDSWENCEEQFQKIILEKLEIEKKFGIGRCQRAVNKQSNRSRAIFLPNNEIQGQAIDFEKLK